MIAPHIHRKWAREFLARAQEAPGRDRKLRLLKLAVRNSVRAQALEAEANARPAAYHGPNARTRSAR
jgi:hypothetical protein